MAVEVAIRAFRETERPVDVKGEGFWHRLLEETGPADHVRQIGEQRSPEGKQQPDEDHVGARAANGARVCSRRCPCQSYESASWQRPSCLPRARSGKGRSHRRPGGSVRALSLRTICSRRSPGRCRTAPPQIRTPLRTRRSEPTQDTYTHSRRGPNSARSTRPHAGTPSMMTWAKAYGYSSVIVSSHDRRHSGRRDRAQPQGSAARHVQGRLARGQVDHAEIGVEHAGAEAGTERLGRRLLGRESLREGRRVQRLRAAKRAASVRFR